MKPHIIIILGMHRSGTSLVSRSLRVFGADHGDNLFPADSDNAKGYWEDIDLIDLNKEMLACLNTEWDHLRPVDAADATRLREKGYLRRALELLNRKAAGKPLSGFKDPRFAQLFPFWREVFQECGMRVSYILALRNPLSVAQSLEKRNQIEKTEGYMMWLAHTMNSLTGTEGSERVVVDYDRLIHDPDIEMRNIAAAFSLTIDADEMELFKSTFVDQSMRHNAFGPEDLENDPTCPELIKKTYNLLCDITTNGSNINQYDVIKSINDIDSEYEKISYLLKLCDNKSINVRKCLKYVYEYESDIRSMRKSISEYKYYISSLEEKISNIETSKLWKIENKFYRLIKKIRP